MGPATQKYIRMIRFQCKVKTISIELHVHVAYQFKTVKDKHIAWIM